jgi:hypothetical protein
MACLTLKYTTTHMTVVLHVQWDAVGHLGTVQTNN